MVQDKRNCDIKCATVEFFDSSLILLTIFLDALTGLESNAWPLKQHPWGGAFGSSRHPGNIAYRCRSLAHWTGRYRSQTLRAYCEKVDNQQ